MAADPARSAEPAAPTPLDDSDELAPPGVRAASVVRWAIVAIAALAAVATWSQYARHAGSTAAVSARYLCPMHASVVSDRPGECPICGMNLVPAPTAVAPTLAAAETRYTCPMHPEVVSTDPAARCPSCGMRLEPLTPAPATPPGLATVDLGPERTQLAGITTAPTARAVLETELRAPAAIALREQAVTLVTARVTGFVEEVRVRETGRRVERGDVIGLLYSPELVQAQSSFLGNVKWGGSQRPDPAAQGAPLAAGLRKKIELLGLAPQDVDAILKADAPLQLVPIRAPVSGFVSRRSVVPGSAVQPGSPIVEIADLSRVWAIAAVPESDAAHLRAGLPARLSLAAWPDEALETTLQEIYPAVSPQARTVQVRVELPNPGLKLRPGMSGELAIKLRRPEALAIPDAAVVDDGERRYVFVARPGGRFEPRLVALGARWGGRVEVRSGLSEGDRVVTSAAFLVDSESRLRAAVEGFSAGGASAARAE